MARLGALALLVMSAAFSTFVSASGGACQAVISTVTAYPEPAHVGTASETGLSCNTAICPDRFPVTEYQHKRAHNYGFKKLLQLQTKLWDAFLYPNNIIEAKAINSSLFATDVIGRIDVTRVFIGAELNTEYMFGLFTTRASNPNTVSLIGYPYAYKFLKFTANQNIASVASLVYIYFPLMNRTLPIEMDLWTTYDTRGKGLITQYDATFRYWDAVISSTVSMWGDYIHANGNKTMIEGFLAKNIVEGICETHEKYCQGTDKQYPSQMDCLGYLATKVRFGQPSEGGGNTVICRMIHQPMVSFRPDVHCPHIGPTGGGMCQDSPGYQQTVLEPIFNISPFVPWGWGAELNYAKKLGLEDAKGPTA